MKEDRKKGGVRSCSRSKEPRLCYPVKAHEKREKSSQKYEEIEEKRKRHIQRLPPTSHSQSRKDLSSTHKQSEKELRINPNTIIVENKNKIAKNQQDKQDQELIQISKKEFDQINGIVNGILQLYSCTNSFRI